MLIETFVETWHLTASTTINSEISFIDEEPDPNGVKNWLKGNGLDLVEKAETASGLSLQVFPDGRFVEEKHTDTKTDSKVDRFDGEGVLNPDPFTLTGTLKSNTYGVFLEQASVPSWANSSANSSERYDAFVRFDDGDTKISDSIEIQGNNLIRTVNVVTDELYLMRVVYVYTRN